MVGVSPDWAEFCRRIRYQDARSSVDRAIFKEIRNKVVRFKSAKVMYYVPSFGGHISGTVRDNSMPFSAIVDAVLPRPPYEAEAAAATVAPPGGGGWLDD
jgi:hypothetical protein